MAWEPRGERLIVAWSVPAAAGGGAGGGAGGAADEPTHLHVLSTTTAPALQVHPVGLLELRDSPLRSLAFASQLGDSVAGGAVVSVAWASGLVSLTPLFF